MSSIPAAPPTQVEAASPEGAAPRVRHQARDAATLMVFSAATSLGVATCFLLLAVLARQA
ncbi:hypothetical protein [Nocardioides sp. SR21]|uniref:hypothetical protein n=1 Tax=Nocardioides sp. SR21 TaxID=2919501 RepID=UPI001FAA5ED7|nr:hypothetical protein [Nocardioides sp. SR21]